MHLSDAVAGCFRLLARRDQLKLGLIAAVQSLLSLLDLAGVLLLAAVASLAVALSTGVPATGPAATILDLVAPGATLTMHSIIPLALVAAGLFITKSVLSFLLNRRTLRFLATRQAVISGQLSRELLSMDFLAVSKRSSQETAFALTQGVNYATLGVMGQSMIAAAEISLLIVVTVGLTYVNPALTLFTMLFFLLTFAGIHRILSRWASSLGRAATIAEIDSVGLMQETLRSYREAAVSGRLGGLVDSFQDLRWRAAAVQSDLQFMNLVPKYVFEIALVVGALLLTGSQLFLNGVEAAAANIAIFFAAGSRIMPSLMRLQNAVLQIRASAGSAAPALALAGSLNRISQDESGETFRRRLSSPVLAPDVMNTHGEFVPRVEVTGATILYPGADRPALYDAWLDIAPGKSVALVGPTGAGKSTLADAIMGILPLTAGAVRIGGRAPTDATSEWPGAIAYVPQEVSILNGTVRRNVLLGLPDLAGDDDAIWNALHRAHLDRFLREQRDGLDTALGEFGVKLSGGQRQRLGLARALYSEPRLIVLDEATSALDATTEAAIAETMSDLHGTVTTITIAHRLGTVRRSDVVVYLHEGLVRAQGTFSEVRDAIPEFDHQARLQGI